MQESHQESCSYCGNSVLLWGVCLHIVSKLQGGASSVMQSASLPRACMHPIGRQRVKRFPYVMPKRISSDSVCNTYAHPCSC
jgi:hypothetical protein